MTKHTPGPWVPFIPKNSTVVEVHDENRLPIVAWSGFDDCRRNYSEQTANARLIAAAPQLAKELKTALALVRLKYGNTEKDVWEWQQEVEKLLAALDAAEGK